MRCRWLARVFPVACFPMVLLLLWSASAAPATAQSDEPEAFPPVRPPPQLLVAGRLSADADWCLSWPLVLTVRTPPSAPGTPPPPAPALVVRRDGKPVEWPWRPIPVAGGDAPAGWSLAAEALAAEPEGAVEFELRRGDEVAGRVTLRLVRAPAAPSPEFEKQGFFARLVYARAIGDAAALLTVATEYVTRFPEDPDAHVARGDALVAAGNDADALAVYRRAIELSGEGIDPPQHILTRYHEALGRLAAQAPTRPAAPPTAAEIEFFAAVDAGDAALGKGDFAEAVRGYERALRVHRDNKLTQDAALIEERLAAVRKLAEAARKEKGGK